MEPRQITMKAALCEVSGAPLHFPLLPNCRQTRRWATARYPRISLPTSRSHGNVDSVRERWMVHLESLLGNTSRSIRVLSKMKPCGMRIVKHTKTSAYFIASFAASSINEATSTGLDASEAWLAARVMTFFAPSRADIRFSFSGAIILSSLDI